MTVENLARQIFTVWERMAPGWERRNDVTWGALRHMNPAPNQPGIFALADPARIETLVVGAGFEPPEITRAPMRWPFDSFGDYWAFTQDKAGALAMVIERLPEADQDSVRASVREALGSKAEGSFELDGLCLNVSTRPADL